MNNIFVYCEIEENRIADVSLELITRARGLAKDLNCQVEAIAIGEKLDWLPEICAQYGVSRLHIAEDKRLKHYLTLPHCQIVCDIFRREKPQIALMGATTVGRDLGPRILSLIHISEPTRQYS